MSRLLALVLLACVTSVASAQTAPRLELAIEANARERIDGDALAAAIARDLSTEVAVVDASVVLVPGQPRITLHGVGPSRLRLTLVREDGSTLVRTTRLLPDPDERVATVVILAGNMVRDEAGELLALLHRPAVVEGEGGNGSEGLAVAPAPLDPVVVESPPPPGPVAVDAPQQPSPSAQPSPHEGQSAPEEAGDPFMRIGVSGQFGSVPHGTSTELAWLAGIEVAATPLPFLAIGVRELGAALAENGIWNVGGAPFAELAWRLADWGDLHGGAGVHIQYLNGTNYEGAGAAPFGFIGARLYADPIFSIAVDTAIRGVASNAFHVGQVLLPQGAVLWTGGISLTFHIR